MRCTCRVCALLFDRTSAGSVRYKLVPERYLALGDLAIDAQRWAELKIPVGIFFLVRSTPENGLVACYPSPAGPTESLLDDSCWDALVAADARLAGLEPDVEALLVNRAHGAREHFLVPLDACVALVAVVRTAWRGLSGGTRVWHDVAEFLARLRERSTMLDGSTA
jgi:hypothetical protein